MMTDQVATIQHTRRNELTIPCSSSESDEDIIARVANSLWGPGMNAYVKNRGPYINIAKHPVKRLGPSQRRPGELPDGQGARISTDFKVRFATDPRLAWHRVYEMRTASSHAFYIVRRGKMVVIDDAGFHGE